MQQFAGAGSGKRSILIVALERWARASNGLSRANIVATMASAARIARTSDRIVTVAPAGASLCMSAA
jgi:hypothetical protein